MQTKERARKPAISPLRNEDYAGWYQSVVAGADLAEMAHVRGCMVIKPWGYGIWSQIQTHLDRMIRDTGHENAYFPLFIPVSYLQKEADHVKGFAKEMAVVTHHRLEERDGKLVPAAPLTEPLVVRPTSETIIGESMHQWVKSYRDLPMLLNQWANVVRWEMRPRVFLRTTEFLWQEGHTAHATSEEAFEETVKMHRVYQTFAEQWCAIPVIPGEKPPSERFPGAERSLTIEAMMQDGKALQAGTSHFLGQNFARAADISFSDRDGSVSHAWTTSWGLSTRMIGAIVMTHGDDDGLRVPPRISPEHLVIVPLERDGPDPAVTAFCEELAQRVQGKRFGPGVEVRVRIDARLHRSVDKKWQWIRRGAPLLVEVGPREVATRSLPVRVRSNVDEVRAIDADVLVEHIGDLLDEIHDAYYAEADARLDAGLRRDITDWKSFEAFFANDGAGFVVAPWCGKDECERQAAELGVTIRCIPFERGGDPGVCVICGERHGDSVIFGRSY